MNDTILVRKKKNWLSWKLCRPNLSLKCFAHTTSKETICFSHYAGSLGLFQGIKMIQWEEEKLQVMWEFGPWKFAWRYHQEISLLLLYFQSKSNSFFSEKIMFFNQAHALHRDIHVPQSLPLYKTSQLTQFG